MSEFKVESGINPVVTIPSKLFTAERPQAEGQYLWRHTDGCVTLISVLWRKPTSHGGIDFEGYWGVIGMSNRNVEHLQGTFLKLEVSE
ncbi:hypothetical protein GR7B_00213 [Vibrio phage vB_VcorM_GR7B]|nr:hypothetical protein GR7B_00213 [Vibrio phage vB_VcorM_GR7B]